MSNFGFLPKEFNPIAEASVKAESHIMGDPRAACFHARFALEAIVHWLYRHDPALRMPYDQSLGALLHEPSFQNLLNESVLQKVGVIHKQGNQAVHSARPVRRFDALQVVKELHHVCYWLVRTYAPDASREGAGWRDDRVPSAPAGGDVLPRDRLEALERKLAEQNAETLKAQKERDAVDAALQATREELAKVRAAAEARPDLHDYSEAETRAYLIDVELHRAGWALDQKRDREYEVHGMPNGPGVGYVDYVLWGDDGKPLGVVEAKKTTADARAGQQQAKLYADCLERETDQRPIIFYTNGYTTWIWDDQLYPPRQVAGFYKKDELNLLIRRRSQRAALDTAKVKEEIAGRYYQTRVIGSIAQQFANARRKALLVMATGTGKTRTAIALVDLLQRSGWVKRALFLADRVSLVKQACNAFKAHLPDSSPVNLVTEKDTEGRVYVCTYPTMLGLIDERFGVGHFDLVIIDEAHRSVYQRYRTIFEYFDSLLVGLTATPRDEVDKNTYDLFDLEPGVPTDAYELELAVQDGFLVPPQVEQVDLRFPREGIDYDQLTEEEKRQWEELDWGDSVPDEAFPPKVPAAAINRWLFNKNTVDEVLRHLMERGHKVEAGDRLAKTIIFARNHDHAVFIEERFNHHYPQHAGHFARVIDNQAKYPQTLIDDFSIKDKAPHIAISVDMLDTGIDVPEVANLVFFKPVYSKIKFWQMIGRGTRLCEGLFGPDEDKEDFRVFDFCFNFDFFKENPNGINASDSPPLGTRLFRARVDLIGMIQGSPTLDPDRALRDALVEGLHIEVQAMNTENFIVRMKLETVERFQRRGAWETLSEADRETLRREVAGLPSEMETDDVESRLFDLTALRMQLALVECAGETYETHRARVVEMAGRLEEKVAIPAIAKQIDYLRAIQDPEFWEGATLATLENMRLRLRGLVPFLDKGTRKVVYTDFKDQVTAVREFKTIEAPKMTGAQYQKKVNAYLRDHIDDLAIRRVRMNQELTPENLEQLERKLIEIGADEGETLLEGLLAQSGAPSLVHFIRGLVGLDRTAAQDAFAEFLNDQSLSPAQMRFVELIIDGLTQRGVVPKDALYDPPFSDVHSGGPEELFAGKDNVVEAIFETLEAVHSNLPKRVG